MSGENSARHERSRTKSRACIAKIHRKINNGIASARESLSVRGQAQESTDLSPEAHNCRSCTQTERQAAGKTLKANIKKHDPPPGGDEYERGQEKKSTQSAIL